MSIAGGRALHHVALRCADVERTAAFYETIVLLARGDAHHDALGLRSVWLSAGGVIVMCERREPEEPAPSAHDKHLLAFTVTAGGWPAVIARLAAAGVPVEGETSFTLYARDPDGRRVAFSSYPAAR